jgi:hypothetical protein
MTSGYPSADGVNHFSAPIARWMWARRSFHVYAWM